MSEMKNKKDTVLDDLLQDPFGDITLETRQIQRLRHICQMKRSRDQILLMK